MQGDAKYFSDLCSGVLRCVNELEYLCVNLEFIEIHRLIQNKYLTGIICSGVRFLKLLSQLLPRFFGQLTILYLQQSASLCPMFEKVRKERLTVLLHFQIRCQTG